MPTRSAIQGRHDRSDSFVRREHQPHQGQGPGASRTLRQRQGKLRKGLSCATVRSLGPDQSFSWVFFLKIAVVLPVALVAQSFDKLFATPDEANSISAYLATVGTLYSVLVAFVVIAVWSRFNETDGAVKTEARELRDLWRYVGYSTDPERVLAARAAIERYRDEVISSEWSAMEKSLPVTAVADEEFIEMARAVENLAARSADDLQVRSDAIRLLGAIKDARGERLHSGAQRLPYPLRLLLYLVTLSLLIGVLLLPFQSVITSSIVVGLIVLIELLVLEVIDDIDNPFGGIWSVTTGPYRQLWFGAPAADSAAGDCEPRVAADAGAAAGNT